MKNTANKLIHLEYKIKLGGSSFTQFGAIYDVFISQTTNNQVLIELWTNRIVKINSENKFVQNKRRHPQLINKITVKRVPRTGILLSILRTILYSKKIVSRNGYEALRVIEKKEKITYQDGIKKDLDGFYAGLRRDFDKKTWINEKSA